MLVKLFTKSLARLEQALDIRSERHEVITSNIANQDTPGFKAKSLDFKAALQSAEGGTLSLQPTTTNQAHLRAADGAQKPFADQITLSAADRAKRLDGNTVNAEKEMTRLAENTFMYQTAAQLIAGKFRGLKNIIHEGR